MAYSYLAVPYTHENGAIMDLRAKCATHAAGKLMKDNEEGVYSPITHIHDIHMLGYVKSWQWENFLSFDKDILKHASRLYVLQLTGWEDSPVVREEMHFAESKLPFEIPIYFLDPETWVPEYPLKYLTEMEEKYGVSI